MIGTSWGHVSLINRWSGNRAIRESLLRNASREECRQYYPESLFRHRQVSNPLLGYQWIHRIPNQKTETQNNLCKSI